MQPSALPTLFSSDKTSYWKKEVFDEYIYAYRFAVLTGLRPGELVGLTPNDVKNNIVSVKRSINKDGEITTGKNDNAIRHFNLSAHAAAVYAQQRAYKPFAKYLFDIPTQKSLYSSWHRYCDYNNIPRTSLYELRHTFVSISAKLPEKHIKALVGHSKSMDTYGVYAHELENEAAEIAQEVTEIFNNLLTKNA